MATPKPRTRGPKSEKATFAEMDEFVREMQKLPTARTVAACAIVTDLLARVEAANITHEECATGLRSVRELLGGSP